MIPAELAEGELEILGLLPAASNYTFLARLAGAGDLVVYKPRKGETPLWDFPEGTLCQREVAAYLICAGAGWEIVPPTILRDGPLGPGAVQQFIEHDSARNAFNLMADHAPELKKIALFDLIVNNADRKAGHVLADADERLWAVDHGLCFHEEPKLRTVLWDYIGDPISQELLKGVDRLSGATAQQLYPQLESLLLPREIDLLFERIEKIRRERVFPRPGPGRPYPWPPI